MPAAEQRGQCFNLACGLRWFEPQDSAAKVFETIYRECHLALLNREEPSPVLAHSMVGTIPFDRDMGTLFVGPIDDARQRLEALNKLKPGRPSKDFLAEIADADALLKRLQHLKVETERLFATNPGARAYFWTDANHRIVQVTIAGVVGRIGKSGLFNHGLFAPGNPTAGTAAFNGKLIVVPTPEDVIAVQTAVIACAASESVPAEKGYIWCAAMGSSEGATVRALTRMPVVLVPESSAGQLHVDAVRELANLHVFHPPGSMSVADWLNKSTDPIEELENRFAQRVLFTRPIKNVASDIDVVRVSEGRMKKFEVERSVGRQVAFDLMERGKLYFDGQMAYAFLHDTKDVIPIDVEHDGWRHLANRYGVMPTDSLAKPLAMHLTLTASEKGDRAQVYPFVHYDESRGAVYLFNLDRTVYRITADQIDAVDNGADGALFVRGDKWSPFELQLDTEEQLPDVTSRLIGSIQFAENQLHRHELAHLFRLQLLAMFFPELFPTRPILAMVGPKGSGKTSSLELTGTLLFGPAFKVADLTEDARDLDAALTSEFFVVADNADRDIQWLPDKLAVVATGGTIKRRMYYTTNKQIEFPLKAWLAITSRTPHFRREDVADRLLPLHVQRFEGFSALHELKAEIVRDRNLLLTSLARDIQKVLRGLRQHRTERIETKFRMADFGQFAFKASAALGFGEDIEGVLRRLAREQMEFSIAGQPLFEWLDRWLALPGNAGRQLTTGDLYAELRERTDFGISPWETAQEFGRVFVDYTSTLETLYSLKQEPGRSGTKLVQLWPAKQDDGIAG